MVGGIGILTKEQAHCLSSCMSDLFVNTCNGAPPRFKEPRIAPARVECFLSSFLSSQGDCIPPHIDHHDFLRPFCTLSLLSEAKIVFGTKLEPVGEGEFEGPVRISLPVG